MGELAEVFVGIDVAKARNAIAVADGERGGEVRFLGEVDASPESMRRIVQRLAAKYDRVHFCYEAGPTGYGLHRLITALGHACTVVAPSLIPRKPGDRVKTNRRDAVALGQAPARRRADRGLGAGRGPRGHARPGPRPAAAVETLRRAQAAGQRLHAQAWPASSRARRPGACATCAGCRSRSSIIPAHQIVLQEMVEAVRLCEGAGRAARADDRGVPASLVAGPGRRALQALRGVDLIVAVTFVAEVGDISRFESPRQLMGYLGLVPSERSTGDTVRRGGITKAGNGRVRHLLVESAWTYRHPPRIGKDKLYRLEATTQKRRRDVMVESFAKAGWQVPVPTASMFAWAQIPEKFRAMGSLEFSKLLVEKADVAVAPGIGFGEHGDDYVRIALVENEQRIRQAARNIRKFFDNADHTLHNVVPQSEQT